MKRYVAIALAALLLSAGGFVGLLRLSQPSGAADADLSTPASATGTPVVAEAHVVPTRSAVLSLASSGIVAEVLVTAGSTVPAGELLARLARAEAQLANAEAQLKRLLEGVQPEEIEVARAQLTQAEAQLQQSQSSVTAEDIAAAEALLRALGGASFLLVTPPARMSPEALRDRLQGRPGIEALLTEDVIANDAQLFTRVFSAPLRLMVGIAFLIGTLVVGLVIYTATVERRREYRVLKAVGARGAVIYRIVLVQTLVVAGVGAAAGVGLAFGAAQLIMLLRPQFLVVLEPGAIGTALLAGLAMALLAALVPVRALARLEPAEVFQR